MGMVTLLKTKLYVPPIRSQLVQRPRLIGQLSEGIRSGCKLTLLSAPAGFGKTTLLANWIRQANRPVAWLSLDSGDNDPARFWSYVISALQTVAPGIGQAGLALLQSPQPPPIESVLTALVNEIADTDTDWVLALDDFHVVTESGINHSLVFLLDHLPPHVHMVLSTRADPPWPLARLRVRGEVAELRTEDLRFTLDEASTFMRSMMGLDLSAQDIAVLDARTEGWIAGLQLAALSMQGRDVHTFVQTFGASNRFILDYLVEEVLGRQRPEVQAFLLETSILERLTASLCDAVREGAKAKEEAKSAQEILEALERANLFVIPLDDERRWYRYHHLFADLLLTRLKQTRPDLVSILHLRASRWYEESGLIAEAVEHALAAGDVEQLGHLVETHALNMIYHGELSILIGWLGALPEDVMRAQPWLCVAYAWALAYSGELDAAERVLLSTSSETGGADPGAPETGRIAGHIAAIRGYCAMLKGDAPRATRLAHEALQHLPERELVARGFAAMVLGTILGMGGDSQLGLQLLSQALVASRSAGDELLEILTLCELSALQSKQGQLHDSAATCREALHLSEEYARRSGQQPPAAGFSHVRLAMMLYEWDELEAAVDHADLALALFRQWGQKDGMLIAGVVLAHLGHAMGDLDSALDMIGEAKRIASDLTWYQDTVAAFEMWLHLMQGEGSRSSLLRAARWVQESGLSAESEIDVGDCTKYVQWAQVLIALGRERTAPLDGIDSPTEEALRLLGRLLAAVEAAGSVRFVIKTLALQAVALQDAGEQDRAQTALLRALALAEPEGYVRAFVEEGEPMERLLAAISGQHRPAAVSPAYLHKLLGAFDAARLRQRRRSPVPSGDDLPRHPPQPEPETRALEPLVEPLSDRELDVLRLLPTDLSSTEIAQELYISRNTVRTHIKHIYDKLGVHSREDAVQRAQELSLL
jgi:LuxR family maltose regulon positive regulatory protein